VRVFRLCRRPHSKTPLDGRGGLHASGRWHTPRRLVTYASESLALAGLEVLVHFDVELAPSDLFAIEIDIPRSVRVLELVEAELPSTWRRYPAPTATQRLGNAWLDSRRSAILRVPSVLIPSEKNFLINPLHPDIRRMRVVKKRRFSFDARLL